MNAFNKVAVASILGSLLCGILGLAAGFFGPLIFTPQSNQGPLLAIFIGPVGYLLGAPLGLLAGLIYVRISKRRHRS